MPTIQNLSSYEAQKIAAGEVVERPANVVKELVENALDAQATSISIYIEEAGKRLIRVIDNGCGMDHEDARLCFGHHATSKITSVQDLESLQTFGFRGEALSSIASVSNTTLITKNTSLQEGIKLELDGGSIVRETFVSANPGTDICIKNLFFNVPARKKFLRTNETEWRQIVALFQAFCLDYQNVSFKLFHGNQLVHNCPATDDLTTRCTQLWDNAFAATMLPVSITDRGIHLRGVISHQHYTRYDRSQIFFFVNNRWVRNNHLSRALLKGYMNVLPPARYPAAFLFITIPSTEVDINIHPRKEEVQFLHPRIIERLIQESVKSALEHNITSKVNRDTSRASPFNFDAPAFSEPAPSTTSSSTRFPSTVQDMPPLMTPPQPPVEQVQQPYEPQKPHTSQLNTHTDAVESEYYSIIGQIHKTYILVEHPEGLFLVDQHAAHERILYEQFRNKFHEVASTQLLFPAVITLSKGDIETVLPHCTLLEEQGIRIERFGEQQVVVHATPIPIKDIAFDELLRKLVGWLHEHRALEHEELGKLITEKLHAQMACKAAVKAGDVLSTEAMEKLLRTLQKTDNRFSCPHGRPTGWLITHYEIEKKFKRKG